jgi:hypothetical protein
MYSYPNHLYKKWEIGKIVKIVKIAKIANIIKNVYNGIKNLNKK